MYFKGFFYTVISQSFMNGIKFVFLDATFNNFIMKKITYLLVLSLFCFTAVNAQSWKQLRGGGKGQAISNDNGTVWVIGIGNSIFSHNGRLWREYPGGGKALDIAVHNGTPYIIGLNNGIWKG